MVAKWFLCNMKIMLSDDILICGIMHNSSYESNIAFFFLFCSAFIITELLYWSGAVSLALLLFTCRNSVALGWSLSVSFLFWLQTLCSSCKHLDYAAPCICSCAPSIWNSLPF